MPGMGAPHPSGRPRASQDEGGSAIPPSARDRNADISRQLHGKPLDVVRDDGFAQPCANPMSCSPAVRAASPGCIHKKPDRSSVVWLAPQERVLRGGKGCRIRDARARARRLERSGRTGRAARNLRIASQTMAASASAPASNRNMRSGVTVDKAGGSVAASSVAERVDRISGISSCDSVLERSSEFGLGSLANAGLLSVTSAVCR